MSDFVRELVGRALGTRDVVRPRLASAFEPGSAEFHPPAVDQPGVTELGPAPSPTRTALARSPAAVAVAPDVVPVSDAQELSPDPQQRSSPGSGPGAPRAPSLGTEPSRFAPEVASGMASPPAKDAPPREPHVAPRQERADPSVVVQSEPMKTLHVDPAPAGAPRLVESRVVERQTIEARRHPGRREPAPRERRAAEDESAAEPVVHVHIGRIEVRAPAQPGPAPRAPRPREPNLSLADYLAQGNPGRR